MYLAYNSSSKIQELVNNFLANNNTTTSAENITKIAFKQKTLDKKITSKKNYPKRYKSNPYAKEDKIAFNIPKKESRSLNKLADYIKNNTTSDKSRARVIYTWVAHNIRYDDKGYNTGDYGDLSAKTVLKSKTAVCSGYSNLFKTLCEKAGLKSIKISGYAKGYGFSDGQTLTKTNHAWNAVKIDNKWELIDVTWASGHAKTVNGKMKSTQDFTSYWFCVDPYAFIYKHLPKNPKYQGLPNPITKQQYEHLPIVGKGILQLGFPPQKLFNSLINKKVTSLPTAWAPNFNIKVKSAKINKQLMEGKAITVKIECPFDVSLVLVNNENWVYLTDEKGYWQGTTTVKAGTLLLCYKLNNKEGSFSSILKYDVKKEPHL